MEYSGYAPEWDEVVFRVSATTVSSSRSGCGRRRRRGHERQRLDVNEHIQALVRAVSQSTWERW